MKEKFENRFCDEMENGKQVTLLYFGGHDPSGLDMVHNIRERLVFMFANGGCQPDYDLFDVVVMGLNMKQIKQYNLPPNPAKLTDTSADAYIEKYSRESWEVDTLKPDVSVKIVSSHIEDVIDMDIFAETLAQEKKDKTNLTEIIKKWKE